MATKGRVITLNNTVGVAGYAATVGKKEHEGPLGGLFSDYCTDERFGESTFEAAESAIQKRCFEAALEKAGWQGCDAVFAGDLQNQCTASHYAFTPYRLPHIGLYGACSTMALSLAMGSLAVETGGMDKAAAVTSSHFCTAERQFRYPLEYGNQRTPTAQWTVTGGGCVLLENKTHPVRVKSVLFGRLIDYGITDISNMGAAMAPAAADSLLDYFASSSLSPSDFDAVYTGDLGFIGTELLYDLLDADGLDLKGVHNDCGCMIFERKEQDVHAGGSGCGCSAAVLCGKILPEMERGESKRVLFCATGALMSPTTVNQGQSIPAVAHIVELTSE